MVSIIGNATTEVPGVDFIAMLYAIVFYENSSPNVNEKVVNCPLLLYLVIDFAKILIK